MYQGRELKNFYHINDSKYILHFEDDSTEVMSLNSLSSIIKLDLYFFVSAPSLTTTSSEAA